MKMVLIFWIFRSILGIFRGFMEYILRIVGFCVRVFFSVLYYVLVGESGG